MLFGDVVVAVEEQRAIGEVARRPQPEELVEIALRRRLRLARADRADAPAPVAGARPVGADGDALAVHRQPARPAAVLRHARIIPEQARAVAADEAGLLHRAMAAGKGQFPGAGRAAWREEG